MIWYYPLIGAHVQVVQSTWGVFFLSPNLADHLTARIFSFLDSKRLFHSPPNRSSRPIRRKCVFLVSFVKSLFHGCPLRRMWEKVIMDTLAHRPNKKVDYVVLRSEQVKKINFTLSHCTETSYAVSGNCAYFACQVTSSGTDPQRRSCYQESAHIYSC